MDIRPMTKADLDRVDAIEQAVFPNPWSRECFRAELKRTRGLSLVAEEDGQVVAYLVVWGGSGVHISNIAVVPERRRAGIGRMLMDKAEGFASSVGLELLSLEVRESNTGARAFYLDLGFSNVGVREGYYENDEDAVVMAKPVPGATG